MYRLKLYVTGATGRSQRAVANARKLCDHMGRSCELEVIDLYERPKQAIEDQVVASPTLVRVEPLPKRRLVGDLSDQERLFALVGQKYAWGET
jgi:hypothetical protein